MQKNKAENRSVSTSDNKNIKDGISEGRSRQIRQNSLYNEEDLPDPDNNLFWEHASNPLSSKGN